MPNFDIEHYTYERNMIVRSAARRLFTYTPLKVSRSISSSCIALSGHNKWSTIKHDKAKKDALRSKINTKYAKLVSIAIREGGSADPEQNVRLQSALDQAVKNNVPKKVVENAINRETGAGANSTDKSQLAVYEGLGPGGVAVVVEAYTDNRARTAADVKHAFNKGSGSMSPTLYLFERKGCIGVDKSSTCFEELLDLAVELGAEDVEEGQDMYIVVTDQQQTAAIATELKSRVKITKVQIEYVPDGGSTVEVDEDTQKGLDRLLYLLDDLDDVTAVYTNCK